MMSIQDAAFNVVRDYPGGAASLAPRMDKSATTLNHELTRTGSAKLGLLDAAKISELANDRRILAAFAAVMGCTVLDLPQDSAAPRACTMAGLARLAAEFGDVVEQISRMTGGKPSANDLARLRKEWSELVSAGIGVIAAVEASA